MGYKFTDADRAKGKATQAKKRAEREAARAAALDAVDIDRAKLGSKFLAVLEHIVDTSKDDNLRLRAIRTALPYLLPSLRQIESETGGADPININIELVDKNRARHGDVDPAEFGKESVDGDSTGTTAEAP